MPTKDKISDPQIIEQIEQLNRKKVVRQLHDGLTQSVSALAMRINFTRRLMDTDLAAAGAELDKVEDLTRLVANEIRHIIFLLRPDEGQPFELPGALELLADKLQALFDLELTLEINPALASKLPEQVQRLLFAVVEEAIDSARKRTGSQQITVSLEQVEEQFLQLLIEAASPTGAGEPPFQGVELENIQHYAGLVHGSVLLDPQGQRMRLLFPVELPSVEPGSTT